MVKIRKRGKVIEIPKSAYKNFYQGNGWELVEGSVDENPVNDSKENNFVDTNGADDDYSDEDDVSDEEWDSAMDEVEKPISEMNAKELKAKAESMGIDVTGLTTNKMLREAIRNYSL